MKHRIFPSVMAKNQKELDSLLKKLKGSSKQLHLDVADGKFVPSKSLWFRFKLSSKFKYNVHLMIKNPEAWIKKHGKRVNLVIPQLETVKDLDKYVFFGKKKIAFALKPGTKIDKLKPYLWKVDYILILTVHPGYYGSKYLRAPLKKIRQIKRINPKIKIIIDGGMNPKTIRQAARAGADYFVSGSYVTKSKDPKKAVKRLDAILGGPRYVSFNTFLKRAGKRFDKLFLGNSTPKPPEKRKEEYISLKEMKKKVKRK